MVKQFARYGIIIWVGVFFSLALIAGMKDKIELSSPDGNLKVVFYKDDAGRLRYELLSKERVVIEGSELGLIVDGVELGKDAQLPGDIEVRTVYEQISTRGNHWSARNYCNTTILSLKTGKTEWQIEARIFNDGLGFRYLIPGKGSIMVSGETTSFKIPGKSIAYFQTNMINNEGEYERKLIEDVNALAGMPVTMKLADDGGYIALTESAVYNWSGMALRTENDRVWRGVYPDDSSFQVSSQGNIAISSPWRVIMVAKDLNGLVNCDIVYALSPAPDKTLFADADLWIKPGRALWSWWREGTGNLETQKRYAESAQKLGFEFILVDEGWERWSLNESEYFGMLKELCDYASSRGVKVWVWKHWSKLKDENYRRYFFQKVKESGAVGVKIDFMDSESKEMIEFYESALKDAARSKLMVNFHGANKPTGEARTYPNEMTREGVRGLEYNKGIIYTLSPSYNATLPFTRFLAGHADYTPVTFSRWFMGKTSFAHQLATPIVFLSELTHYADKPEMFLEYDKTAPALDVLKSIPTVWDETIVLPGSEIGEVAGFARRSGKIWFIGVLNGGDAKTLRINLSFLGPGNYQAVILVDKMRTKMGFERSEKIVNAKSILEAKMRAGGGFVAKLTPAP